MANAKKMKCDVAGVGKKCTGSGEDPIFIKTVKENHRRIKKHYQAWKTTSLALGSITVNPGKLISNTVHSTLVVRSPGAKILVGFLL